MCETRYVSSRTKHFINAVVYHWIDAKTGERRWNSEVSSIDSVVVGWCSHVRQYFSTIGNQDSQPHYERVDFAGC